MKHASELTNILNENFMWSKPRIECFVNMLLALVLSRTVNLAKISCLIGSKTKISSRYRRLQRFFQHFKMELGLVSRFVFHLFGFDKVYLTMDRTNWKWGTSHINILMLGIAYRGIAIPIFWILLGKAGNSDTQVRIDIIKTFIKLFGKDKILGLLADREFVGSKWFRWLNDENIPFYIRIKNNTVTTNTRGLEVDISELFYGLAIEEQRVLKGPRKVYGNKVYLAGLRTMAGELLIVATNRDPQSAITIYAKRWEIETLFGCLKGRGFCFEDTHMTQNEKIAQLIALLTIAFCWAHKTGIWRHEHQESIRIKTHGRLAISFFRYGLDYICDCLGQMLFGSRKSFKCMELLRPYPTINLHITEGGL